MKEQQTISFLSLVVYVKVELYNICSMIQVQVVK